MCILVSWASCGVCLEDGGVCRCPPRPEEVVGSLELELEMIVIPKMWVL